MAKVITFSRKFPAYHPKAGQPTYFVEQVLNAIGMNYPFNSADYQNLLIDLNKKAIEENKLLPYHDIGKFCASLNMKITTKKLQTIRSGHRFQAGEKASFRVWSGVPYNSPQIIFAPDQEVKQVIDFKILKDLDENPWIDIGKNNYHRGDFDINQSILPMVARNDGLETQELLDWFQYPKPFDGQIIAWKGVPYV